MRWYGMNEERIPKKVLNMNIEGRHSRVRPRSRWEEQVRNCVTTEGRPWEETEKELQEEKRVCC
jgi:hypothetical protein